MDKMEDLKRKLLKFMEFNINDETFENEKIIIIKN